MSGDWRRPDADRHDATPITDDPTRPADGLDPGEEGRLPLAPRHHGAVNDPSHPDFMTIEHRRLPEEADLAGQPERALVVDTHASQVTGAGAATQGEAGGQPANRGSTRPDGPGDPRRDLPAATPDST